MAILREATFFNPDLAINYVAAVVLNPLGATILQYDVAQRQAEQWSGRVVFNAGESMEINAAGSIDVTLSGYLLTAA